VTVYVTYIFDHRRRDEAKSVLLRHILLNKQDQEKVTCMIGEIKLTALIIGSIRSTLSRKHQNRHWYYYYGYWRSTFQ